MDDNDPISQFFPDQEAVDLYEVLCVKKDAIVDDIKKAYRRLALVYHPDKHASADASTKAEASTNFQQIGFAYAVLGDEKRRQIYDRTGKTDEGFELAAGDDGWEAYFEEMFDRVTRGKLDEMKNEYQNSAEEIEDLKKAYTMTGGSIEAIMAEIPHSTHEDEARFIVIISDLIASGSLPTLETWKRSVGDEKARLVRKKQGEKEAKEAEKLAKELGVWDEFYGSGKKGTRKTGSKGKKDGEEEEDHSTLQALILKKKEKNMDSFFDSLSAKYAEAEPKGRGKGRKRGRPAELEDEEGSPLQKKVKDEATAMPDIDDEEFARLQAKLFDKKDEASSKGAKRGRGKKKGK